MSPFYPKYPFNFNRARICFIITLMRLRTNATVWNLLFLQTRGSVVCTCTSVLLQFLLWKPHSCTGPWFSLPHVALLFFLICVSTWSWTQSRIFIPYFRGRKSQSGIRAAHKWWWSSQNLHLISYGNHSRQVPGKWQVGSELCHPEEAFQMRYHPWLTSQSGKRWSHWVCPPYPSVTYIITIF